MTASADRRQFWRAAFHSAVELAGPSGSGPAELLDISLRGALLEVPAGWAGRLGESWRLRLRLAEDAVIAMDASVAHLEGRRLGLRCRAIDLDSITHLRRLVELNAGDPGVLERELAALLAG